VGTHAGKQELFPEDNCKTANPRVDRRPCCTSLAAYRPKPTTAAPPLKADKEASYFLSFLPTVGVVRGFRKTDPERPIRPYLPGALCRRGACNFANRRAGCRNWSLASERKPAYPPPQSFLFVHQQTAVPERSDDRFSFLLRAVGWPGQPEFNRIQVVAPGGEKRKSPSAVVGGRLSLSLERAPWPRDRGSGPSPIKPLPRGRRARSNSIRRLF